MLPTTTCEQSLRWDTVPVVCRGDVHPSGARLEHENKTETRGAEHAEFVARNPGTAFAMAVEAKARERDDVSPTLEVRRSRLSRSLRRAARKRGPTGQVVFSRCEHAALAHAASLGRRRQRRDGSVEPRNRGRAPFEAVLCTNRPHQYGGPAEPSPPNDYFIWVATDSQIPDDIGGRLFTAMSRSPVPCRTRSTKPGPSGATACGDGQSGESEGTPDVRGPGQNHVVVVRNPRSDDGLRLSVRPSQSRWQQASHRRHPA